MTEPVPAAVRAYALLLRLYPTAYQRAFGAQMLQTFRDHYAAEAGRGGRVGPAFWLAVVGDEAGNILHEQAAELVGDKDGGMNAKVQWVIGIGLALAWMGLVQLAGPFGVTLGLGVALLAVLMVVGVGTAAVAGAGVLTRKASRAPRLLTYWRIAAGLVGTVVVVVTAALATSVATPSTGPCTANAAAALQPPAPLVSAQDYFAQGDREFDRGACTRALADFSQVIALDPNNAQAYNNRAYTYMALQNYAAALPDLDQAIALRPDYVNALMNRGDIYNYYYNIDRTRALADYDRVIAINPSNTSVCGHRAMALLYAGDTLPSGGVNWRTFAAIASDVSGQSCQVDSGQ